ncbi:hypothetical protein F4679DRAFT_560372 [Xylaria curta]|nr:hypothetical protein F4679DRAFT_560372 [Xylaria curta]
MRFLGLLVLSIFFLCGIFNVSGYDVSFHINLHETSSFLHPVIKQSKLPLTTSSVLTPSPKATINDRSNEKPPNFRATFFVNASPLFVACHRSKYYQSAEVGCRG